jgi:hypothetical protein
MKMRHVVQVLSIILFLFPVRLLTQPENNSVITGQVIDSDNGNVLDKVIVYLANTPLGNSSDKDGKFRISFIPKGEYQLIISRVGYERKNISVKIANSDSLFYEIKLQQRPISTGEIEVLGERPKELRYGGMLFPKDNPHMYCVYSPVSEIPVGVFYTDSAFYMYSLETTFIDSQKFIRLWLLYKNQSHAAYHLNPMECVKLHIQGKHRSYTNIPPIPPSTITALTESIGTVKAISATVGKSITNLAIQRAKFIAQMGSLVGAPYDFHTQPLEDWTLSGRMFGTFRRSLNSGVMERYVVDPECSVNGYIYFSFPEATNYAETLEYLYRFEIMTQTGSKFIEFVPR